jgi:hypothetical protein
MSISEQVLGRHATWVHIRLAATWCLRIMSSFVCPPAFHSFLIYRNVLYPWQGVCVLIVFHIYLTLTLLACGHGLVSLTYLTYACESLARGRQYSSDYAPAGRQMPQCRR